MEVEFLEQSDVSATDNNMADTSNCRHGDDIQLDHAVGSVSTNPTTSDSFDQHKAIELLSDTQAQVDAPSTIVAAEYQLSFEGGTSGRGSKVDGGLVDVQLETANQLTQQIAADDRQVATAAAAAAGMNGVATCTADDAGVTDDHTPTIAPSGTGADLSTSTTATAVAGIAGGDEIDRRVDGDIEWRQSSSLESQCSSACSVDTIQSVHKQPTVNASTPGSYHTTMATHDDHQLDQLPQPSQPTTTIDESSAPVADESAASQPEAAVEQEPPRKDFTTGITCCDVPTALDILNTRYRLADVTIHKNMITWSSWNIADMVRGPHRESFWWKGKRRGKYALRSTIDTVDRGVVSNSPQENGVDKSIRDIEVMCEKIEIKEKEIQLMLQKDEQRQHASAAAMPEPYEPITVEVVPARHSAPPVNSANVDQPQRQKRENVFQRLLRALRRRFSRQQQQQQQQELSSSAPQREQHTAGHRRQRTL